MTTKLNEPNDWDFFERALISKASSERVLHLMQLNNTDEFETRRRHEPTKPEVAQYKAKVPYADEAGKTSFVRGEQPAKAYAELLDEDKEDIKFEQTAYRTSLAEFNREADALRNVSNWINEHISPYYVQICSPAGTNKGDNNNLYLFFEKLRAACGADDLRRKSRARKAYYEALEQAKKPKTDWEAWINNWEQVMNLAQIRRVSTSLNSSEWFDDLKKHLNARFEGLLRAEKSENKVRIKDDKYHVAEFANAFREEIQTEPQFIKEGSNKPSKPRIAKGNFGPTYQGENPPDEKRKRQTEGEATEHKDKQPKTSRDNRPECILCGKKHKGANTRDCWLLFPENLPSNLDKGKPRSDRWIKRLEEVPEARNLYNRLVQEKEEQH
jgi:hypothetical protein